LVNHSLELIQLSFFKSFVEILDSINVPQDFIPSAAELPDIIEDEVKKPKIKKREKRPYSAPENPVQFPQLPSEVLRRAVSARKPLEEEPQLFFNPLHTETFDNQLLLRLQAVTEPENKFNPLHPLSTVEKVSFQDAFVGRSDLVFQTTFNSKGMENL
jgi:hypothetical protein